MAAKLRKRRAWENLPPTNRIFRPYSQALGEIALAWNGLHHAMAFLFASVMGGGITNQYFAVWNAIRNDRTQRAVLLGAAKTIFMGLEEKDRSWVAKEIAWLCAQASRLEDARDDALHSPFWGFRNGDKPAQVHPASAFGHPRAEKLADSKDLLADLRWCRDGALVLEDYVKALGEYLSGRVRTWPDRPSLPNRGQTNKR